MKLDQFTLTIIYLALPNIVLFSLFKILNGKNNDSALEKILYVVLYSVISYLMIDIVLYFNALICSQEYSSSVLEKIFLGRENIPIKYVFFAVGISILLSLLFTYIHSYKWIHRLAQVLRMTRNNGEDDVWHDFLNSHLERNNGEWYNILDH